MIILFFLNLITLIISENLINNESVVFIFKDVFSSRLELAKLITGSDHSLIETETLIDFMGTSDILDIDISVKDNAIFLLQANGLYKMKFNPEFNQIISTDLIFDAFNAYSMTYDWIHDLLYFTVNNEIHVIKVSDVTIRYVFNATAAGSRKLAVNPIDKFILWTNHTQIIKANPDGTEFKLLYETEEDIQYLFIDFVTKNICFASNGNVLLIDYSGNNRQTFGTTFSSVRETAVLKDLIFFERIGIVYSLDRKLNNSISVMKYSSRNFRLIHSTRQPNTTNICAKYRCSHLCLPLPYNAYRCVCPDKAFNTGILCEQNSNIYNEVMVLYSNQNGVLSINFNSFVNNELENSEQLFSYNKRQITDLYYSTESNLILWSVTDNQNQVLNNNTLFVAQFNRTKPNILGLNHSKILIDSCDSVLGYDWIHNLIYIDINNTILVFNMNRTHIQYKIAKIDGRKNVISFAVNPVDSKLFWCESKKFETIDNGVIVRANQDGSDSTVIVDHRVISRPLSLTIDYSSQRLLWFDNGVIQTCDFFGQKLKVLFRRKFFRISSINVFERYVYFMATNLMRYTINEELGVNEKSIVEFELSSGTLKPTVFEILDSTQQPTNTINRCFKSNCTHLCLPVSIWQYRCVCPETQQMSAQKCIETIGNVTVDNTKVYQNTQYNANSLQTFMIIIVILILLVIFLVIIIIYRFLINKRNNETKTQEKLPKTIENNYDEISVEKFMYEEINYEEINCVENYDMILDGTYTQILGPDIVITDIEETETDYLKMISTKL